jgi:peptidoglycan/xylan/chitin deacetylase (PgdA/CDA1 family)
MHAVGLPATFFVSTDMIGSTKPFPHDLERGRPGQPHMTWDDLRHLAALGFDIGSHTCSHADMGSIPDVQAQWELQLSRERLEAELRQPVRLFAFPYGARRNMRTETMEAARREYDVCCSAYGGHNTTPVDPANVRRIVISSGVSFLAFRALLEGWPMLRLTNPRPATPAMVAG